MEQIVNGFNFRFNFAHFIGVKEVKGVSSFVAEKLKTIHSSIRRQIHSSLTSLTSLTPLTSIFNVELAKLEFLILNSDKVCFVDAEFVADVTDGSGGEELLVGVYAQGGEGSAMVLEPSTKGAVTDACCQGNLAFGF